MWEQNEPAAPNGMFMPIEVNIWAFLSQCNWASGYPVWEATKTGSSHQSPGTGIQPCMIGQLGWLPVKTFKG